MPEYNRRQVLGLSLAGAAGMAGLTSPASEDHSEPPVATRMFWTWDHSTEWVLNVGGAQTLGASNSYGRPPEIFVKDYTRLLRWCGRHGIDAVIVWGLLRDVHGGVDAVKRLCDVAVEAGVRLLPGVGLNAYGGVYYQGKSPHSLQTHLEANPRLYGLNRAGKRMIHNFGVLGPKLTHHACPSRKENQQFAVDSLGWLFETLPGLGGVQLETGDTGVCRCDACEERRQCPVSGFSWEGMALMYPMAAKAVRSVKPDAWIICETYSHPEPASDSSKAPGFGRGTPPWANACLARFPKGVFVQWTCDNYLPPIDQLTWTEAGRVVADGHRHVMRAHYGTYWSHRRGELSVDWIARMFQRSMASGFGAISLFGEVSPFHTGAEMNYLALVNYGSVANPTAKLDVFLRDVADPLLGGASMGGDYLRYARLLDDRAKIPVALAEIRNLAAKLPPDPARRWLWLANFLASYIYQES